MSSDNDGSQPRWQGLSEQEAARRLLLHGPNLLPDAGGTSWVGRLLSLVSEPIFLLLFACGGIYLLLGETQEAAILLAFVVFIIAINAYQDRRTERSLDALKALSSPRALVIRDGVRKRIAGRDLVPGDLIVMAEGDRVPADARLLWSTHLSVDESLLTGESMPVRKRPADALAGDRNLHQTAALGAHDTPRHPAALEAYDTDRQPAASGAHDTAHHPGGEDLPWVFSSTLVVQGQGIAEVMATGAHTEIGLIGKSLLQIVPEQTPLQRETARVVGRLTWIALGLCALVVIFHGLLQRGWLDGFLAGLALAMAILPNEIPVVLTLFLALGAWRFSRQRILTRRAPVVETLGTTTVLCVDKTGTLTRNEMHVRVLCAFEGDKRQLHEILPASATLKESKTENPDQAPGNSVEGLPESVHRLVEFGILASRRDPFDPMEKALQQLGIVHLSGTEHLHGDWVLQHEYPLSDRLLAMSCVWGSPDGSLMVAAKGAPEAIADLCHLPAARCLLIEAAVQDLAARGLRVLGVACGRHRGRRLAQHADAAQSASGYSEGEGGLPSDQHDFEFDWLGLIGLEDPVRPGVSEAVAECQAAGIRVVMITGDYPVTAQNIARQIGLQSPERVVLGADLESLDAAQRLECARQSAIFARVTPGQKLTIVETFKQAGEIVAMTGDGVNDAPALRAAHVGIAMGGRGTDVAREAADLVVTDDDFSSIVAAIRLGRRVFENLRKGMAYTLAVHLPIAGLSLMPILLGWPLILLPIHIAFLHLIIDPACTIVFEGEADDPDLMRRPPRPSGEPLFDGRTLGLALLQGASALVILLGVFALAFRAGDGTDARALAFTALLVSNLAMILTNRSWNRTIPELLRIPNPAFWWVSLGAVLFLAAILMLPPLRHLFRFAPQHGDDLVLALVAGVTSILWFEVLKVIRRRRRR